MKFNFNKSLLFIFLLIILCLSISCVSASEDLNELTTLNNIMVDDVQLNEINDESIELNSSLENNSTIPNSSVADSLDSEDSNSKSITNISTVSPKKITLNINYIVAVSHNLKLNILSKKALPDTVKVGSYEISIYQFSCVMAEAIKNIKANKKTATITVRDIAYLDYYPYDFKKTISASEYLSVVNVIIKYGSVNKAPSYVNIYGSKADFRVYTYGFAKILSYYKSYKRLPKTAVFENSNLKKPTVFNKDPVKINDILTSATNLKNYVIEYNSLPTTVKVGSKTYSTAVFSYLLAKTIGSIDNGNLSDISSIKTTNPSNPSGAFYYDAISKSDYVSLAKRAAAYAEKNYRDANYITFSLGNIEYQLYTYEFANILDYYKLNGRLPSTCTFNSTVFIKKPTANTYTLTCLNWGSKGNIANNKVLMKNINRNTLANNIIAMCKKGTPILAFGNGEGPVVVINSGIHGNELSSQAASFKLINRLVNLNSKIKGTVYVIPVISPAATAKNVRSDGVNLNTVADKPGTLSNNLIRLSLAVNAKALGDFHCSKHGGDPGKNVAMGSYNPNGNSAKLAKYISSNANVACLIYNTAGSEYPGAVEDVANLNGITAVTCEVLTNHGQIESGTVTKSYTMMNYFLRYFGLA